MSEGSLFRMAFLQLGFLDIGLLIRATSIKWGSSPSRSTSQNSGSLFPLTNKLQSLSSFSMFCRFLSPLSSNLKQVIKWKFENEFLFIIITRKQYCSTYLILFLLRSSSLRDFNLSRKSIFTMSLFEALRIFKSFSEEYWSPQRSWRLL